MTFPQWTRRRGLTKQQQASLRLRYIMNRLAAEHSPVGSLKSIADAVGISHSTILIYVGRGKFSEPLAQRFQETFPAWIKKENLTTPLSISEE